MKVKVLLIQIFIISFFNCYAQNSKPDKIQLLKVINLTIKQKPNAKNNNFCENGLCGEWWSNNRNGEFYKNDTIKLYNSSNFYPYENSHCTFMIWDFDNNNNFSKSGAEMCTEPPLRTTETTILTGKNKNKTLNKYKISQEDDLLYISILSTFEKYQVISIDENKSIGENSFILTLVRKKLND